MKKLLKISVLLLAAVLVLGLAGCGDDDDGGEEVVVDFTSYNTDYSILVRNYTSERLVAFKGDLHPDYLIGGIPANANNHGLPNNITLFDKTEDFSLILLTEAQYNANKDNLYSQRNTPFTRVYVFYNRNGENLAVYEIARSLGGPNTLNIINSSSSINIELRLGGPAGETIGFAPAGILNTSLKLQDGNHTIAPVFKRYNSFRDLVETVIPRRASDNEYWRQNYSFGEGDTQATMNLKELLQGTLFSSGAAWVVVNNQTNAGVRFLEGSNVYTTATGLWNTMPGNPRTFQVNMPKAAGDVYAETLEVYNWRFGDVGDEVALQSGENDTSSPFPLSIAQGKIYTVTVTGSANDGNQKAWISSITDIPENELGGSW